MKFKFGFLLISTYAIAFSINLLPSLKHPDSDMSILHLLAALLFLFVFLMAIKKVSSSEKIHKGFKTFLVAGFVSGLVVYIFKLMEDALMSYAFLDVVASIQYLFYLLFITPLFGVNYLFDISYETFSLLMSAVYVLIFIIVISYKKVDVHNV